MRYLLTAALLLGLTLSAPALGLAATYTVTPAQSSIAFSGTHAGSPFKGTFKQWQADVVFDSTHLAASHLNVTLQARSASTGNPMYDGTLPSADWFDAARYPTITFTSSKIEAKDAKAGVYTANGSLMLHGVSKPVSFDFTVTPPAADATTVKVTSTFTVNRLDYAIGQQSDPKAEWVGKDITLTFTVTAARQ